MILSAGIIPIRETEEGMRVLLLRVYRYWDFPKGEVAAGEDHLQAACRELREETGIVDVVFPWGTAFYETPPYRRGKVARYYLGRTETEGVHLGINPELGRPEHHGYLWASAEQARGLLNPRVRAALDWALQRLARPEGR
jgi:bis(5'-nucleosidyl)-tetraphosphatase